LPLLLPPLAQIKFWDLVFQAKPIPLAVMGALALLSILSWAIVFSKWSSFRSAVDANRSFARAFRKADAIQSVALAAEQFRKSPVVGVFDFGYEEVARQVKTRGGLTNRVAVERALQVGVSEEVSRLERNMSWLATVAAISPRLGWKAPRHFAPSGPALPMLCSLRPWVCSLPFLRPSSITTFPARFATWARAWMTSAWSSSTLRNGALVNRPGSKEAE
jgi:hypothetical protein